MEHLGHELVPIWDTGTGRQMISLLNHCVSPKVASTKVSKQLRLSSSAVITLVVLIGFQCGSTDT